MYLFFAVVLFSSVSVITSCSDDDNPEITSDPLNVKVKEISNEGYLPGTNVVFKVTVTSGEKMKTLNVMANNALIGNEIDLNNQKGSVSVDVTFTIDANANPGDQIALTFTATDKKTSKSANLSITVASEETPLGDKVNGVIYHMLGSKAGAWDLVNDVERKSSDSNSDKDMVNTTSSSTPAGNYFFEAKWKALNSTKFVAVTNFDYDNATLEAAIDAYGNGNAVSEVPEVEAGDVFVAKLRGGSEYVVIQVENVELTENKSDDTFDNNDNIVFTYKKATAAKSGGKTLMTYR